jgi:transposase InsO family protein
MEKHMRLNQSEKFEIIQLVEKSEIGVNATLKEFGIHKSTFYQWYNAYLEHGYDGLANKPCVRKQYWNQIPDEEKQGIVELALEYPDRSSREVACLFTDLHKRFVSESSVYRILKEKGLLTTPAFTMLSASDEYKNKTVRVNEMWQTDFTYFKIPGWGWYYLSTVLDDYSRFIVHWQLCKSMKSDDVEDTINQAMLKSNLKAGERPKLLSDNGSCYIANDFKEYVKAQEIKHIRGRVRHPQTQGKIERYHRSMKNVIKLDVYYSPMELEYALRKFVHYYNYERYHESLKNVVPADKYYGKAARTLERRKKIKEKTLKDRKQNYIKSVSKFILTRTGQFKDQSPKSEINLRLHDQSNKFN